MVWPTKRGGCEIYARKMAKRQKILQIVRNGAEQCKTVQK